MPVNWCVHCSKKPARVCLDCHNEDVRGLEKAEKMSYDEAMRAQANEDFLIKKLNRAHELMSASRAYVPRESRLDEEMIEWLLQNRPEDDPHE